MKYNLIILAGGEQGPLSHCTPYSSKAMIPICGKPMIGHVIDAFSGTDCFENIVVVGPEELEECSALSKVRKRLPSSGSLIQNLMLGVGYVKSRIYNLSGEHNGYVISFCDAVFLTPEIISDVMKNIEEAHADVVLHYVEKATIEASGLNAKRTYIPIGGKHYSGGTIYYVRRVSMLLSHLNKLAKLREVRKKPQELLEVVAPGSNSLEAIEKALGNHIGGTVRIYTSPHPMLAMDVDTPSDLRIAEQLL